MKFLAADKTMWKVWLSATCVTVVGCEDWTRLSVDRRNDDPPAEAGSPVPNAPNEDSSKVEKPVPANPPSIADSAAPIDPIQVRWLHTDVSGWPVTTTLHARISGGSVILSYDKARVWPGRDLPEGSNLNANCWIFVQRDGVWYAATWEWLRVGQTSKPTSAVHGNQIKKSPLNNFQPVSGETYGFMVSGLARTNARNIQERSNVVMLIWP